MKKETTKGNGSKEVPSNQEASHSKVKTSIKSKKHKKKTKESKKESLKESLKAQVEELKKLLAATERADALSIYEMYKTGKALRKLKKYVNAREKMSWEKFVAENFPFLPKWSRQRYMRLAKYVEGLHSAKLCTLGQARLFRLIRVAELCNEKSLTKIIKGNGILLPDKDDKGSVSLFRKAVDDFLSLSRNGVNDDSGKREKQPKTETTKPEPSESGASGIDEPGEQEDEQIVQLEEESIIKMPMEVKTIFRPLRKSEKALQFFSNELREKASVLESKPLPDAYKVQGRKRIADMRAMLDEVEKVFI